MTINRPPSPRPARTGSTSRERPAPVFRDFVRALERLESGRGAPRPAREGSR
jgi:hypothetical protein